MERMVLSAQFKTTAILSELNAVKNTFVDNIPKIMGDIRLVDHLGRTWSYVIRYNPDDNDLAIYNKDRFGNVLKYEKTKVYGDTSTFSFWYMGNQTLEYSEEIKLTFFCSFQFTDFPFDVHECRIEFGDDAYGTSGIKFETATVAYQDSETSIGDPPIILDNLPFPFEFQLEALPAFEKVYVIMGNHDLYYRDKREINSNDIDKDIVRKNLIEGVTISDDIFRLENIQGVNQRITFFVEKPITHNFDEINKCFNSVVIFCEIINTIHLMKQLNFCILASEMRTGNVLEALKFKHPRKLHNCL